MKTSSTHSMYCEDDNEFLNIDANKNESYWLDGGESCCRKRIPPLTDNEEEEDEGDEEGEDDDTSDNDYESDNERRQQQYHLKRIGMGVRERDSLLEAVASV